MRRKQSSVDPGTTELTNAKTMCGDSKRLKTKGEKNQSEVSRNTKAKGRTKLRTSGLNDDLKYKKRGISEGVGRYFSGEPGESW